jgi:hypothetical protein
MSQAWTDRERLMAIRRLAEGLRRYARNLDDKRLWEDAEVLILLASASHKLLQDNQEILDVLIRRATDPADEG